MIDHPPLPKAIADYQAAHDAHDTPTALASFASDVRVADDGHEMNGTAEISEWLSTAASEYTFTRTLLGIEQVDAEQWLVINRIEGNFPGGVVDLRYAFRLRDGLIAELVVAP